MKGCYRECLAHGIDETHEGTSNVDSTTSCASTIHLRKGWDTNCDMRERRNKLVTMATTWDSRITFSS